MGLPRPSSVRPSKLDPTFTDALTLLATILLPGPMPLTSPSGIRSVLSSEKPTASHCIGSCPSFGNTWQNSPTDEPGPRPSITRPTTLVTLPWTLTGFISLIALVCRLLLEKKHTRHRIFEA